MSEIIKHDLGDGFSYYEEDGSCYIDIKKDNEENDKVNSKIINAKDIREYIRTDRFEYLKDYFPEDAFNLLYDEYKKYLSIEKIGYNTAKKLEELAKNNHVHVKDSISITKDFNNIAKDCHTAAKLGLESKIDNIKLLSINSLVSSLSLKKL